MDEQESSSPLRADVFFMLLSALLFAYFGFIWSWAHQWTSTQPPQRIPMIAVLMWTLRIGAIAFIVAAALSLARQRLGPFLYAVTGLVTSALFVVVAIWEWTNPNGYYSGVPAILLLVFALLNGYGSINSLRALRAAPSPAYDEPLED